MTNKKMQTTGSSISASLTDVALTTACNMERLRYLFGEADQFESRDCNVRIRVTQKKKGVSLEMTAVRPLAKSRVATESQQPPRIPILDP